MTVLASKTPLHLCLLFWVRFLGSGFVINLGLMILSMSRKCLVVGQLLGQSQRLVALCCLEGDRGSV